MPPISPQFNLYLVTDRSQTAGRDLLWVLEQALEGGVKGVQLREKDLSGRELFHLAEKIKALCDAHHASLLINDRVDVAMAVDADGVHLGGASIPVQTARKLMGRHKLIGVSTHSLKEAQESEQAGADFLVFGPVYFTSSKAPYGEPQGLGPLKKVVEKLSIPVYSIGGIKADNIAEVKATGVRGVSLISAIISAVYPLAATEEILRALER
ncbi:MAG: thiamine phosphate synthase [Nitrospirales bacterium]